MIELVDVKKSYGQAAVLAGVSLEVGLGGRLALVGSSGCGKSTLLRILLGLVVPDAGTATVSGHGVSAATAEAVRLRCGYVIQEGGLFPHLTALGNAALVARRRGWDPARIQARATELFALAGLAPELGARFPKELSGGQRQRVAIVRALMLDPDVLLMDEPLGALDPILRARMQRDLSTLFTRLGKTVLLVTHDMREAAILADTIAVMRAGRIVQRGTFAELSARPADPFVTELVSAGLAPSPAGAAP